MEGGEEVGLVDEEEGGVVEVAEVGRGASNAESRGTFPENVPKEVEEEGVAEGGEVEGAGADSRKHF